MSYTTSEEGRLCCSDPAAAVLGHGQGIAGHPGSTALHSEDIRAHIGGVRLAYRPAKDGLLILDDRSIDSLHVPVIELLVDAISGLAYAAEHKPLLCRAVATGCAGCSSGAAVEARGSYLRGVQRGPLKSLCICRVSRAGRQ